MSLADELLADLEEDNDNDLGELQNVNEKFHNLYCNNKSVFVCRWTRKMSQKKYKRYQKSY